MEVKKKFFMDCHLAGRKYHDADEVWDKLKVGTVLQLQRELDNRLDEDAVAVVYHNEEDGDDYCIGYIFRNLIVEGNLHRIVPSALCLGSMINEEAHPEYQVHLTIKIKRKAA